MLRVLYHSEKSFAGTGDLNIEAESAGNGERKKTRSLAGGIGIKGRPELYGLNLNALLQHCKDCERAVKAA